MNNESINNLYPPAPLDTPAIGSQGQEESNPSYYFICAPRGQTPPEAKDIELYKTDPIYYYILYAPPA